MAAVCAGFLASGRTGFAQSVWTSLGPDGGEVRAIAVAPTAPATVYAGLLSGVFASLDGGQTWNATGPGLTDPRVVALAVDPRDPRVVWATTEGGLFRSTDGGSRWVARTPTTSRVDVVLLDPVRAATVFAVAGELLYKTTDEGVTWTKVFTGVDSRRQALAVAADPSAADTLYVADAGYFGGLNNAFQGRVARSVDGGATWQTVGDMFGPGGSLHTIASTDGVVYVAVHSEVWKSVAGGPWQRAGSSFGARVGVLAVVARNPQRLHASAGNTVSRSNDGGSTWMAGASLPVAVTALALDPSDPAVVRAGTAGAGAHRSTDEGVTWTSRGVGLRATVLSLGSSGSAVHAGTRGAGVVTSRDGGATWPLVALSGETVRGLTIDPVTPSTVYAAATGGLYRSVDGGGTFPERLGAGHANDLVIRDGLLLRGGGLPDATYSPGLERSTDGGATWTRAAGPWHDETCGFRCRRYAVVPRVVADPFDPSRFYAIVRALTYLTDIGGPGGSGRGEIWVSTDGGVSFAVTTQPPAAPGETTFTGTGVTALVADPVNRGVLYAGSATGIHRSADGGLTWTTRNDGLPDVAIHTLAVDAGGVVYAGTSGGVFVSSDSGSRWSPFHEGLTAPQVRALAFDGPRVLAGTEGGGVFVRTRRPPAPPEVTTFTVAPAIVAQGGETTLTWSTVNATAVTLDGRSVDAGSGSARVAFTASTSFTLTASGPGGTVSRTATVVVLPTAGASLAAPSVRTPTSGQAATVSGVSFAWSAVTGAAGYDLRIWDGYTGVTAFSGSLRGAATTETAISLSAGLYLFGVRACAGGGFTDASCGAFATVDFRVVPATPSASPGVTAPMQGALLTASTQRLQWSPVARADASLAMFYEVLVEDAQRGTVALQISVPDTETSTIATLPSSTLYRVRVRACQAACGPYSRSVDFSLQLAGAPATAPRITSTQVDDAASTLTVSWDPFAGADLYRVQVVKPSGGPGGGALTVAAREVSTTSVTLPVPSGGASVVVQSCTGDGCSSPGPASAVTSRGANPARPNLGTPMRGTTVAGPTVLFTWNRVAGDTGSTVYRLYVQDLSRQAPALDVYTRDNFHAAYFRAEGARYDALVVANPGTAQQAVGPAQGFTVAGTSATAPTLVAPAHNSSLVEGNVFLGWSPVPEATLYEYFVAVQGQSAATVRGVASGTFVQVPLAGSGSGTVYSAIVRACRTSCVAGSDAGWGPWSHEAGPGVTNFTVTR